MTTAREASLSYAATSLTLDPGTGLAPPRDFSRDAWGGGRKLKPLRSARPVTDRASFTEDPFSDHARLDLINAPPCPRQQNVGRRRGLKTAREASPPSRLNRLWGHGSYGVCGDPRGPNKHLHQQPHLPVER